MINDIINFYEGIIDITTEVVFNNDTYSLTIEKACSVLEDEKKGEPLARLALVNKLLLEERGQNCLPLEKYNDTINKLKQISWPDGDQWGIYLNRLCCHQTILRIDIPIYRYDGPVI